MKTLNCKFLFLFILVLSLGACSDDEPEIQNVIHPVGKLNFPNDETKVKISLDDGSPLIFSWKNLAIEGNVSVKYEVIFDKEAGGFSKPLKSIVSGSNGIQPSASISHMELNDVAIAAGIKEGETGTVVWSVVSKSDTEAIQSTQIRKLIITRSYDTFVKPIQLFITGSATETGDIIADALEFHRVSDGVFEIFTELKGGASYKLISDKSGSINSYFVNKGQIRMGDEESVINKSAIYRIRLDFNRLSALYEEVKSFRLYFPIMGKEIVDLKYKGKGVWSALSYILYGKEGWGDEERYKFRMVVNKEGTESKIYWEAKYPSDSRPTGNANYYYMKESPVFEEWKDIWKFAKDLDRKNVIINITMGAGEYTHSFEKVTLEKDYWAEAADKSTLTLAKNFWNNSGHFNNDIYGNYNQYGYWPEAHATDILVDAYLRTQGDAVRQSDNNLYKQRIYDFYEGVKKKNGGSFKNHFYDDMAWHGLAHLRAYEATGDKRYEQSAKDLWHWIVEGWTADDGGGILWNASPYGPENGKGVPSNGPSTIIAIRRWVKYGDSEIVKGETNLQWAKKIYNWMRTHRYVPETGRVFEKKDDKGGDWTYNAGTFMGAAMELYDATGEQMYFDDAVKVADYALENLIGKQYWVLSDWAEQKDHDVNLFKAVFIRYFTRLIMHNDLPAAKRTNYVNFMKHNAQVLWHMGATKDSQVLFNYRWYQLPHEGTFLNAEVSGCVMMEAIALLDKKGYLN